MTDRGRLLQDIADVAEALCDPRQHVEPIHDTDQHRNKRLRRIHTVTLPSLLDQLAEAAQPTPDAAASGTYGSRPPGNLDAIAKWGAIQIGAVGLAWHLQVPTRNTVASTIRACVGAAASAASDDQHFTLAELRRWRRWAAVATGWEAPARPLPAPCPLCEAVGSLQTAAPKGYVEAWCTACGAEWSETDRTIGLLVRCIDAHVRSAQAGAEAARARARWQRHAQAG